MIDDVTEAEARVARLLEEAEAAGTGELSPDFFLPEDPGTALPLDGKGATWKELWQQNRYLWVLTARPSQITPAGEWLVWCFIAGRGAGKSRSGAEDISEFCFHNPNARIALVSATNDDVRDTMIEGESGLLSVIPAEAMRGGSVTSGWNRSLIELHLANGARMKGFSAETPERLRGPQHTRAWGDEPASWRFGVATYDMLMLGLRLGQHPRLILTGTPKPTRLIKNVLAAATTHLTRGTTYDNLANLAPTFAAQVLEKYEGTRLGRQELLAELLEDAAGALWAQAQFDAEGFYAHPPAEGCDRIVVGVDPSGSAKGDTCGIVVAGTYLDDELHPILHVLDDRSMQASPERWGRAVVEAYHEFKADRVIIEKNFGGDMAQVIINQIDPSVAVKNVVASRGKRVRAEPVAALYERGRVHHDGPLVYLEEEMTSWEPDGIGQPSPGRIDAAVWCATDLILLRRSSTKGKSYGAEAARLRVV